LAALRGLGVPELPGKKEGQGIQLAKGTKRLGMGRPAAWGAKKQRDD
jgi:hypothetical protein